MDRDYTVLDRPEVLMNLFHPRREWADPDESLSAQDVMIPVESDVMVGARFHLKGKSFPSILFFHGNGEIVADYDVLGPLYSKNGVKPTHLTKFFSTDNYKCNR